MLQFILQNIPAGTDASKDNPSVAPGSKPAKKVLYLK